MLNLKLICCFTLSCKPSHSCQGFPCSNVSAATPAARDHRIDARGTPRGLVLAADPDSPIFTDLNGQALDKRIGFVCWPGTVE
jgi:hypothetical protein